MNQATGDQKEKLPQQEGNNKDPLEEALLKARELQELHKGPDDAALRENSEPDQQERDAEAQSANDSGE